MTKALSVVTAALVIGTAFAGPPYASPQEIRTKPVGIPHEMSVVLSASVGKVELDLTTEQIVVTNTQREGALHLKLFKDFQRVPGGNVVHRDPLRFPLVEGSLYVAWISSEKGFGTATFQFSRGKLNIK